MSTNHKSISDDEIRQQQQEQKQIPPEDSTVNCAAKINTKARIQCWANKNSNNCYNVAEK